MHRIKTKGEVLAAWCEATTVHGVADLYRAKQFSCGEVVFWVFVVFSAFSFAAWQIQGVINSYITGSGYSVNILYNREFPLTFPSIVICNVNRATKTAARELNITSPKVLELFFGHFYSSSIFSLTTNYSKFEPYWKDFLTQHPQYNGRPDLLMTKLAHTCENMIQYMKANDSNVLIGKNCCAPAITNPVRNTYGICNYINVDMFKQLYAGKNNEIHLISARHT